MTWSSTLGRLPLFTGASRRLADSGDRTLRAAGTFPAMVRQPGRKRRTGRWTIYNPHTLLDYQTIRAALHGLGITVRAVQETFDDSASGQLIENVMAAVAQFDNDQRAARTREGMKEGFAKGRWMWRAPIGYLNSRLREGPSLVPDPETAPLIQHAFNEYAMGGRSKSDILAEVTALGLTRQRKPLSPQAFGAILKNPIYTGRIVSKRLEIEARGDFEPLISDDVFQRVQAIALSADTPARRRNHLTSL